MNSMMDFYKNKKILITGHTGFKGSWLCEVLRTLGAEVIGYSLQPPTNPSLFSLMKLDTFANDSAYGSVKSYYGDVRNLSKLKDVFEAEQPQIVIHMAAQPIVREAYSNPVYTYETNVMGTVNVLECCRLCSSVKSVVNVTTDKVYRNNEWERGYVESDYLDGYDPYSNSKSCSELVTHSYVLSFFNENKDAQGKINTAVSTCRAGNVIGGGDFAVDRIVPDCFRAAEKQEKIVVRNPYSIRPYQHVLEPLFAYLLIAMEQYIDPIKSGSYNVGPDDINCIQTGTLVDLFVNHWNAALFCGDNDALYEPLSWISKADAGPHEARFLKLDCTKIKAEFGWRPIWDIDETLKKTVEWYYAYFSGKSIEGCVHKQIREYIECLKG